MALRRPAGFGRRFIVFSTQKARCSPLNNQTQFESVSKLLIRQRRGPPSSWPSSKNFAAIDGFVPDLAHCVMDDCSK
jgi:hypothetical protein